MQNADNTAPIEKVVELPKVPDYSADTIDHMVVFNELSDEEKTKLIVNAMRNKDALCNGNPDVPAFCPARTIQPNKVSDTRLKIWIAAAIIFFILLIITAIVTTVLVIGVRSGKLPEMEAISALMTLAAEILKTFLNI